jgi:hypothetical protein
MERKVGSENIQVVQLLPSVLGSGGSGTDRSATLSIASAQIMAANPNRTRLYIANDTAIDVWIKPGSAAAASAGAGNIRLPANGGFFELAGNTDAWHAIAASGTPAITAREF